MMSDNGLLMILSVPDVMINITFRNQLNCFLVFIRKSLYNQTGSLSEEGHHGIQSLLQKRLADVEEEVQVVCSSYSQASGPNAASLLKDGPRRDWRTMKKLIMRVQITVILKRCK